MPASNHRHRIVGYRTISHVVPIELSLVAPRYALVGQKRGWWKISRRVRGFSMDSGKYYLEQLRTAVDPLSRWTLEQFIHRGRAANSGNIARRDGTRRVAYSGEAAYYQYQLDLLGDRPGYDIVQILHDIGSPRAEWPSLDHYIKQGVQYAIVSSYALNWLPRLQGFLQSSPAAKPLSSKSFDRRKK